MKGLMMSIRELVPAEGEAYLGPGPNDVCAWPECGNEPTWETECEDLEGAGAVANGDRSEIVVSKNVRWTAMNTQGGFASNRIWNYPQNFLWMFSTKNTADN